MAFRAWIVDDSPAMRAFIARVPESSGLEIEPPLEACNGQDALRVLKENPVDFILSDVNMPVMNGEELVRQLHSDEILQGIPVLIVSTDGTEGRMRRVLELAAKGYVKKPFSPEVLRTAIESMLEESRERQ